ncbi:MAG: DNA cytosine methyltransferase [Candidatus Omnitrophota bacterium]|jgi:DNA (cytosine-5)-methyltransferase 1
MTQLLLEKDNLAARLQPHKQKKAPASLFSFFSGAGFLDLGFESERFRIEYVNEIHAPFLKGYRYSREMRGIGMPEFGCHELDIAELHKGNTKNDLKTFIRRARITAEAIGFIGGPPCPDFSIGGKNRGHKGENGKLSGNYIELVCEQKPDFFLFENVKGLWQTKRHRDFYETIKIKTQNAGYVTTERLINAIEYGVPQDRDRIILIGFHKSVLKNLGYKFNNPQGDLADVFPWLKNTDYQSEKVFSLSWPGSEPFKVDSKKLCPKQVIEPLTVEHWFKKNDVLNHPNSADCFKPRAGLAKFLTVQEGDDSRKSYKRLHRWRYSPTACYGNNEVHLHPYKARRISVAEALAIQSLPKDFVLPSEMGLTNLFKTVGNGVPFLVARGLAKSIASFLKGDL